MKHFYYANTTLCIQKEMQLVFCYGVGEVVKVVAALTGLMFTNIDQTAAVVLTLGVVARGF